MTAVNPMQPFTDISRARDEIVLWADAFRDAITDAIDAFAKLASEVVPQLVAAAKAFVKMYREYLVRVYWGEPTLTWKALRYPHRAWHWAFGHSGLVSQLGGYCRACDSWSEA